MKARSANSMSAGMGWNMKTVVGCWVLALGAGRGMANNFTVEVVPTSGATATGADTVIVEVFAVNTSGVDQPFVATQVNLPCGLPRQPGATGFIGLGKCGTGATCSGGTPCFQNSDCANGLDNCLIAPGSSGVPCHEDSNCPEGEVCLAVQPVVGGPEAVLSVNEPMSVNGIPRLFDADDIVVANQEICQLAITSFPAGSNSVLPVGATRYFGAMRYHVSDCAAGAFTLRLEGFKDPKNPVGVPSSTRFRPTSATLHEWTYGGDVTLTIPVGTCCENDVCLGEGMNHYCCEQVMHPGAASLADVIPNGRCSFPCGGCTPCRVFGDHVFPFCNDLKQPDVDDNACLIRGYANVYDCLRGDMISAPDFPEPCEPIACATDADCLAEVNLPAPCLQGRCYSIDVDDLVAQVAAYGGDPFCPDPCPPGACRGDFDDNPATPQTCVDGSNPNGLGMSADQCLALASSVTACYCGDNTTCFTPCPGCPCCP